MTALPSKSRRASRRWVVVLAGCLALPPSAQAMIGPLPAPSIDPALGADVHTLHRLADGHYLVGGSFARLGTVAAPGCGRLLPDGSADAGFACGVSSARLFAEDGAGRVYVVGPSAFAVSRLLPGGALDPEFTPVTTDASITAMTVVGDALYLAGAFAAVNGSPRMRLARLSLAGMLDPAWTPQADASVFAIGAPGDGFLYLGGAFAMINATPRARLARIALSDGSVDAWDAGLASSLAGFEVTALDHDASHLFVSGAFSSAQGQPRERLAKFDRGAAATLDASWAPQVLSAGTQSSGPRLLRVIGDSVYIGDTLGQTIQSGAAGLARRLVRVSRTGAATLDTDFDPLGDIPGAGLNGPRAIVPGDGGGRLFIGGVLSDLANDEVRLGLAALNADGSIDGFSALSEELRTATVSGVAADPATRALYVQGDFRRVNGVPRQGLVRLLPSGTVDGGFRPPITRYSAVAFAGGAVYAADDAQRRLLKLHPLTGDPDPAFTPIAYSQSITALVAAPQDLYLVGSFQLSGTVPALGRFARMRLATDSIDGGFRFAPNSGGTIAGVALDPAATRILLFGNFTAINGQPATQLAKIDAQSLALDAGFQPAIVGSVSAATLDGDGGVWINGGFSSVGGQTCRTPARLLLDGGGALDPQFSCNRPAQGNGALLFDRDGVYGAFGTVLRRYARVDGGSPDPAWEVTGSAFGVRLLIADARLLVHGSFDTFAGAPRRALAAVPLATAVFGNGFE